MSRHKWVTPEKAGPDWARFNPGGKVCILCGLGKNFTRLNGYHFVAVPPGKRKKRQVVVLAENGTFDRGLFGSKQPSCPWHQHPNVAFKSDSGAWVAPRKAKL